MTAAAAAGRSKAGIIGLTLSLRQATSRAFAATTGAVVYLIPATLMRPGTPWTASWSTSSERFALVDSDSSDGVKPRCTE